MLIRLKQVILLLGDLLGLHLALLATLAIRYPSTLIGHHWLRHWPIFWPVFLIWLLLIYINNLYSLNWRVKSREFLSGSLSVAITSGLLSILYFYLNANTEITPKTNLAIFSLLFLVWFLLWRRLMQLAIHSPLLKENLALIGDNQRAKKLAAELAARPGAGYRIAWTAAGPADLAVLPEAVRSQNIHTVVVADDFGDNERISAALFACLAYKISFFNYPDFYELLTGKVPVEAIGPDWFLTNLQEGTKNYFDFFKQLVDYIAAVLILLVSLPAWPLIALLIKLGSRGPVFFRQARLGRHGQSFTVIKFRTMRVENNNLAMTAIDDERVTSFGSFLRRSRLDEVPQTINILLGDMSLIGPRPERPEFAAELARQIPFYATRLLIKPGLTGWDQISGKYHSSSLPDSLEKLQYDLFYLKRRSAYLDVSIALRTIATIFNRNGR
ncbi:MAG: exopolysaccharide biosynthesis polyprenyl glycosylphosphotransferase [Patescibacteria group bacterium]